MVSRLSAPAPVRKATPFGAHNLRLCLVVLSLVVLSLVGASLGPAGPLALAHEGHDLKPAEAAPAASLPRLVTTSESYELVSILDGGRLTIYLDRFADNTPVTDAKIAVTIDDESAMAEPTGDGTYAVASKRFGGRGVVQLVFDIRALEGDDLLIGKLFLSPPRSADAQDAASWSANAWTYLRHGTEDHPMLLSLTLLVGLLLGVWLRRYTLRAAPVRSGQRRSRVRALPIFVLLVPALAMPSARTAWAHPDDETMTAGPSPISGDSARRLPDGKVFVPKPMQRILDVRTVIAKAEIFVGRVITDPNRSGLVQSITGGRVIAPEHGLPRLGQAFAKGDVLALIEPAMAAAERTTISERVGELEQHIAVAEAKLRRLRPLAERFVVPQAQIVETEAELEGLYRRREVVREVRVAPEVLRAPIDGVVAASRVVSGQVVQAQDVLFQMVDPQSLWIEAYDYGDTDPATLTHASARAAANAAMNLAFQGWSRTLQQQATVLQFAIIDPPPSIRVGQPVTVTAQRNETARGIIVDRDAIVRGGNGEAIVWRHGEPESFDPCPVRTEPFDADHVLIAAGIASGERIVIRGANLINQIR